MGLAFLGIMLLLLVGYFVYITNERSGKIAVEVVAVPGDAHITINNAVFSPGIAYLKPGYYEIKATKEGFADFSSVASIESTSDQAIPIPMEATSDEAKKWAEDNQDKYLELEGRAGKSAQQRGDVFQEKNPIVKHLPYDSFLYTIGYKADPSDPSGNSIIIEIDAGEGYRQAAIYQISQWGYNPADFKINFRNYKNPFTS